MRKITLDITGVAPAKEDVVFSITGVDVTESSSKISSGGGYKLLVVSSMVDVVDSSWEFRFGTLGR